MVSFDSAHRAPSLALGHPVRQAVAQLVSALRREDEDPTRCPVDVEAALLPLVELREALFARGGHRPSRIPGHQMSTVYSDPSLMIQIVGAPRGFRLPPHTHSAWNVLFVAEGEMQFTSYRLTDDRSVDRQSKLEVAQDCVLSGGQAGLVGPPARRHSRARDPVRLPVDDRRHSGTGGLDSTDPRSRRGDVRGDGTGAGPATGQQRLSSGGSISRGTEVRRE